MRKPIPVSGRCGLKSSHRKPKRKGKKKDGKSDSRGSFESRQTADFERPRRPGTHRYGAVQRQRRHSTSLS